MIFLHESNRKYNFYRFSYKFAFIFFLYFLINQKEEPGFQQAGSLVTRNRFVFCLYRVALYFKAMSNSIDFYKRILLHVIRILLHVIRFRIIVPWFFHDDSDTHILIIFRTNYCGGLPNRP